MPLATKDISDLQVCRAVAAYQADPYNSPFPYELLAAETGASEKVCYRAMERAAHRRDLIEYGVSLRTGWLTEKGKELLRGAK